ncbi:MAG TPA: hypothetical protein VK886_16300 [Vicinamibacterales bacterium]|nr:hypothetical protein [Vicinamibacterales bacterium]
MLIAYLIERVRPRLFLPLAAIVAVAAAGGTWAGTSTFASDATLALMLLVQFRIWDDLADRHADAAAHPHRVLVRAASTRPLVAFCLALAAANLFAATLRASPWIPTSALAGLNGLMAAYYARPRPRTAARDHLLLAKYPLMVLVIAGSRVATGAARVLPAMATVYLAACLHEAWHDPASPAAGHRALVASEAILLAALTIALSIGGPS